jgi:transcriptional regulator with XRE-family HTH domain
MTDHNPDLEQANLVSRMRGELSQSDFARRLGISQPYASDLERGFRRIGVATYDAMIEQFPEFHVELSALIRRQKTERFYRETVA